MAIFKNISDNFKTSKHPKIFVRYGKSFKFLFCKYQNIQSSRGLKEVWLDSKISLTIIKTSKHPKTLEKYGQSSNIYLTNIKTSKHPRFFQKHGQILNFLSHNYQNIQTSKDFREISLEFQICLRQISKHPIIQRDERGMAGLKNISDNYQNIQRFL